MKNETRSMNPNYNPNNNFNPYAGMDPKILNSTHFVNISGKLWKSFRNIFEAERAAHAARNNGCCKVEVYRAGEKNI